MQRYEGFFGGTHWGPGAKGWSTLKKYRSWWWGDGALVNAYGIEPCNYELLKVPRNIISISLYTLQDTDKSRGIVFLFYSA